MCVYVGLCYFPRQKLCAKVELALKFEKLRERALRRAGTKERQAWERVVAVTLLGECRGVPREGKKPGVWSLAGRWEHAWNRGRSVGRLRCTVLSGRGGES